MEKNKCIRKVIQTDFQAALFLEKHQKKQTQFCY
jgi:hypothetical protein